MQEKLENSHYDAKSFLYYIIANRMLGFLATYYLCPILSEITNVTRSNSYSKIHRRKIVVTFIFPSAQLTSAPTPPGSLSNFSYLEKRKKPMVNLELEVRSTNALRQIFVTFVTCLNFASLIIYLKMCFHPNQNFQKKATVWPLGSGITA